MRWHPEGHGTPAGAAVVDSSAPGGGGRPDTPQPGGARGPEPPDPAPWPRFGAALDEIRAGLPAGLEPDARLVGRVHAGVRATGHALVATGVLVLFGWWWDVGAVKTPLHGHLTMRP